MAEGGWVVGWHGKTVDPSQRMGWMSARGPVIGAARSAGFPVSDPSLTRLWRVNRPSAAPPVAPSAAPSAAPSNGRHPPFSRPSAARSAATSVARSAAPSNGRHPPVGRPSVARRPPVGHRRTRIINSEE